MTTLIKVIQTTEKPLAGTNGRWFGILNGHGEIIMLSCNRSWLADLMRDKFTSCTLVEVDF